MADNEALQNGSQSAPSNRERLEKQPCDLYENVYNLSQNVNINNVV